MKKWWMLTKALVRGSDAFGTGARKKKGRITLVSKGLDGTKRIFLAVLAVAYVSVVFGIQGWALAEQFLLMGFKGNNPGADPVLLAALRSGIGQLYLPGFFLLLGMGFIYSAGIFYFAEDLDTLLALPLKPATIVAAKISNLYIFSIIIPAALTMPGVIVLGYRLAMPPLYYFYAVLLLLFGSVIPMCLDAIVILLMMRVSVFTKSKDRFMIITQILMFVGIFAFIISNASVNNNMGQPTQVPPSNVRYVVPLSDKAIEAMTLPNDPFSPLKMLSLIVLALISVALLVALSSRIYLRAARESRSRGQVHKPMTGKEWKKLQKTSSDFGNMVLREFKSLLRSPVYVFNILIFPLIMVVVLVGSMLFAFMGQGGNIAAIRAEFSQLFSPEGLKNTLPYVLVGLCAGIAFLSSTNYCMTTAISREGKEVGYLKSWPLKISTVFASKLAIGELISLVSWLPVIFLIYVLVPLNIYFHLTVTILLLFLPATVNVTSLLIDLRRPILGWTSEQSLVKQNMNVLKSMLLAAVQGGILVGVSLLALSLGAGIAIITVILAAGSILLFALSVSLLTTMGKRYYLERVY
ncbi:MAG TPA: PGG domain-containing protein [Clostridiaceae bacterium]|nr:PGG domain-containing protein [Clostridiaceae bacterium]